MKNNCNVLHILKYLIVSASLAHQKTNIKNKIKHLFIS